MSLRCLLFSSHPDVVQPIREVLAEIGIEGEHCESAVDAVEKVTTRLFQIVITDWSDQPEASFLLKTARDLKATQRPLTLAIVNEADRPQALQAGANSILLMPMRTEQVRDTMRTACELLRARQQPAGQTPAPQPPIATHDETAISAMAVAAGASAGQAVSSTPLPSSVTQVPETSFRPGEFLPIANSGPGAQFDTEKEPEVAAEADEKAAEQVNKLTELEPMAASVDEPEEPKIEAEEKVSGWAALQAKLTAGTRPTLETNKTEIPEEDTPAVEGASAEFTGEMGSSAGQVNGAGEERHSGQEAAQVDNAAEEAERPQRSQAPASTLRKRLLAGALAACAVLAVAIPQARVRLIQNVRCVVKAAQGWLNPPPPQLPQAIAQHESFGQAGEEYNLPAATPIPDATTDPSQIRVVPVIDPTAKPDKNADANSGQAAAAENPSTDQNQGTLAQNQSPADTQTNQIVAVKPADAEPSTTAAGGASSSVQPVTPPSAAISAPARTTPATPSPLRTVSTSAPVGIPSSLQTQLSPNAPAAGGAMPPEAAMSAIEPVKLPQSALLDLLVQHVDPEYPAAAKASGQTGTVMLQVLIDHDGAVQDAKFLQGSLMFARPALDAVKQWRFKPYVMNGSVVSVQSTITLNLRPQ
jgi:periplasmic protein TonB